MTNYEKLQARSGLRPGQIVIVKGRPSEEELEASDWPNAWVAEMDEYIGKLGTISAVRWNGIEIDGWLFPYFALRLEGH